jgi:uncharacterized membrane protein YgdD (TMEM256/DUF423 family)
MHGRVWLVAGSLLAALDVGLAAYGAHGLRETLERLVPSDVSGPSVRARQVAGGSQQATPSAGQGDATTASPAASEREREIAKRLANFDTAVRYQMYHALGLVALGLLATRQRSAWFTAAGWLFLGGVAIFCGLLYALVFSGPKVLGAIVPLGGLAMIAGWVALAVGAWRAGEQPNAECGVRNAE